MGENLLLLGLITLITQTAFSLALCYYAHDASNKINLFAAKAYESDWYQFTASEQRAIYMIMLYGQQEIRFTGFNIISCSMETFAMVRSFLKLNVFKVTRNG